MAIHARRQVADFPSAVVVDSGSFDNGVDMVPIGHGIGQAAEHHNPSPAGEHSSLRLRIESPAEAVGRQDLAFAVQIAPPLRRLDGRASGQRHVTFAVEQCL